LGSHADLVLKRREVLNEIAPSASLVGVFLIPIGAPYVTPEIAAEDCMGRAERE
jgi:hypothetical protein